MDETIEDEELEPEPLASHMRGAVSAAEDGDLDLVERHARDRLRNWVVGGPPSAPRIGRFTVLRRLGAGGMGTVYAAYDDELDRRVALKFLHPGKADDPAAQHRLLREAQALARLSHPHLVPVFEVGRFDGQVYLAMELVAGPTMREWTTEQKPTWRQVLAAWIDVGRALELVHGEGLVHRDVKPDNVILGDDGRVRLVDFGLAREVGELGSMSGEPSAPTAPSNPASSSSSSNPSGAWGSGSRLAESVTHSRAVLGTPAYLAPEQRMGEPCRPAADQYGFCVALYECLYGMRPPGPVHDGVLVRVPDGVKVPAVLRRALTRGLAFEPDDRFPTMAALLAELGRPLSSGRQRWSVGVVAVAVTSLLGMSLMKDEPAPRPAPCDGVEATLAAEVAEHEAGERTAVMDAFVDDWGRARREACEATRNTGLVSVAVLDRRVACLDRLGEQVVAVARGTDDAGRVDTELAQLSAPADCLLPGVAAGGFMPPSPSIRPRVTQIRERLAQVRQSATHGDLESARTMAAGAYAQAEALDYEPLLAEVLVTRGAVETMDFRTQAARDALERAVDLAEAHGDLVLKDEVLGHLVRLAVDLEVDAPQARRAWRRNAATLRRLGPSLHRTAHLLAAHGLVQRLEGDLLGAEVSLRAAEALYTREGPRANPARVSTLRNLARVLTELSRSDDAATALAKAATLDHGDSDDDSPRQWEQSTRGDVALAEGNNLLAQGRMVEARVRLEEAMAEYRRTHGPNSAVVGHALISLTQVAVNEGRLDDTRRLAESADLAFRTALGVRHRERILPLSALGTVAFEQGRFEDAVDSFESAVQVVERLEPAHSLLLALHRSNLAEALVRVGRLGEARQLARAALSTREARLPPDHLELAFPLRTLGELAVREGSPADGIEPLRRALTLHQTHAAYPVELARTRAWLARAHHEAGEEREARPVAETALAELLALGEDYADEADAMRRLLDALASPA